MSYDLTFDSEDEATIALRKRYAPHLAAGTFHNRLRSTLCPAFAADYGANGRCLFIVPNAELIAWIALPLSPGLRTWRMAA